jgi:hypothetical protein
MLDIELDFFYGLELHGVRDGIRVSDLSGIETGQTALSRFVGQLGPGLLFCAANSRYVCLRPGWLSSHPPSSAVVCTQGRESGGSGFETRSGVIPQASLL